MIDLTALYSGLVIAGIIILSRFANRQVQILVGAGLIIIGLLLS